MSSRSTPTGSRETDMPAAGTQIHAPRGYLNLEQGAVYHFLQSNENTKLVSLVQFIAPAPAFPPKSKNDPRKSEAKDQDAEPAPRTKRKPQPRAILVRLGRSEFEAGLDSGMIKKCELQNNLPPWLSGLTVDRLHASDAGRRNAVKKHAERIKDKLKRIASALKIKNEILASEKPEQILGRLARSCKPAVNETRYSWWFYTRLAFEGNDLALHYSFASIGHWNRLDSTSLVKRGAPSRDEGPGHGYNTDRAMLETILESYRRLAKSGIKLDDIYVRAIVEDFGCKTREVNGAREFYHPRGERFPTEKMYWYHVDQTIGKKRKRRTRIGRKKERSKFAPFVGSFSSNVANLMERVEGDAYVLKEVPRGLISDADVKPLVVVRLRDQRSGLFTGIGFSFGSETSSAYRMARFVQAVDKVWLCSLFGIRITAAMWPSEGNSPHDIQDRGPGGTDGAFAREDEFTPVIVEGSPSRSPQSKALIEASNPREPKVDDQLAHMRSDKNAFQLVVQEIWRLIRDNDSMNVKDRVSDDLLEEVSVPTPLRLWKALDARMRNDGVAMLREDAIRAFLTPAKAKLTRRGVELMGRVFRSDALDKSGLRECINGNQTLEVDVWVLEACVRHIWLDMRGKLIQLDMTAAYRTTDREFFVTLSELQERADQHRKWERKLPEHQQATEAHVAEQHRSQTGKSWRSAKAKPGRAKYGTKQARSEGARTRALSKGKEVLH